MAPERDCDATLLVDETPFDILPEHEALVRASEAFKIVRRYLDGQPENTFCSFHKNCDTFQREKWLLHRDILHVLLVPVLQLFSRSSSIAEAALCSSRPEDLELAFRGDARGAFLWLQCLLSEEEAWCNTRGCPACVVTCVLSTESTIRLALTATSLASHLSDANTTSATLSLPDLTFFHGALTNALSADSFWGPSYISYLESRADVLTQQLKSLILQCQELEALVLSPNASSSLASTLPTKRPALPLSPIDRSRNEIYRICEEQKDDSTDDPGASPPAQVTSIQVPTSLPKRTGASYSPDGPKIAKSRLAKRQLKLRAEERAMMRKLVSQCWGAVALWKAQNDAGQRLGNTDRAVRVVHGDARSRQGGVRRRSLTCP